MTIREKEYRLIGEFVNCSTNFFDYAPGILKDEFSHYMHDSFIKVRIICIPRTESLGVEFDNPILNSNSTCHEAGTENYCAYVPLVYLSVIPETPKSVDVTLHGLHFLKDSNESNLLLLC